MLLLQNHLTVKKILFILISQIFFVHFTSDKQAIDAFIFVSITYPLQKDRPQTIL